MSRPVATIAKEFERLSMGMQMLRDSKIEFDGRELTLQEKGNLAMELKNLGQHFLRVARRLGINDKGEYDSETVNPSEITKFSELNDEIKELKNELIPIIQ